AVVGARGPTRLLRIRRTRRTRARAGLRQVARAGRPAAHGAGGLEGIGRTGRARPVAGLGHVTDAGRGAAHAARRRLRLRPRGRAALGRALRIWRTGGAEPVADLHQVAGTRRVPTQRAGIPGRVLARIAAPVADVHRAGIEILRARAARRHLRIDRAVGAGAVAALGGVALIHRHAAFRARRRKGVRRAVVRGAIACLSHVAG